MPPAFDAVLRFACEPVVPAAGVNPAIEMGMQMLTTNAATFNRRFIFLPCRMGCRYAVVMRNILACARRGGCQLEVAGGFTGSFGRNGLEGRRAFGLHDVTREPHNRGAGSGMFARNIPGYAPNSG